ncbi:hypothetical protein RFI_28689, partial [Reticulomyxa filosa]
MAVTNRGMVYVWGLNEDGRLGLDHRQSPVTTPTLLEFVQENELYIKSVSASLDHSTLLTHSGYVYCIGCMLPLGKRKTVYCKGVTWQDPNRYVLWTNRTKPFLIWSKSRIDRVVNSNRRMLLIDAKNNKVYFIGESYQYDGQVVETLQPLLLSHQFHSPVVQAVLATSFFVVLLRNGTILSRDKGDATSFSKVALSSSSSSSSGVSTSRYQNRHRHHHGRIPVKVVSLVGCDEYCAAVTNTCDVYMWKPPKTTADL